MGEIERLSFSKYFGIEKKEFDKSGFFDISLISDLPLFIDPFHLFYSDNEEYQELHEQIIKYLIFLKEYAALNNGVELSKGIIDAYYRFPEVHQNWFGFTFRGNRGHGLGVKFAKILNKNFGGLFKNFGQGTETQHLEKLTLIATGTGRDTISDFTTNLIQSYLAKKTEEFALKYIKPEKRGKRTIKRAEFDYSKKVWVHKTFILPIFDNDYVLLTPRDLLTKDDTWINRTDLIKDFEEIPNAISNEALREQLRQYFQKKFNEYAQKRVNKKTRRETIVITKENREKAIWETIEHFPQLIDVYINLKEKNGDKAKANSEKLVSETENIHQHQYANFISNIGFLSSEPSSYKESLDRVIFFKERIELHDCYKNLYNNGVPVDEDWVQRMFWFVWFGSEMDVNRDPNNGLGKPDFVVSHGRKNKTPIEFKLAKSSSLEKNILKQLETYKKVEHAPKGVFAILFFNAEEEEKVKKILMKHNLLNEENYILIDARNDNKAPASKRS